jgi:hypothetical protein
MYRQTSDSVRHPRSQAAYCRILPPKRPPGCAKDLLPVFREIDEDDAGPAWLTDMRDGVGDPGWRVPFGALEQGSGLVREPQRQGNIGFALLRWLLHPTPLRVRERDGNRRMSLVSPPRLGHFRAHHATNELPLVVNGLYEQLDRLRKLLRLRID